MNKKEVKILLVEDNEGDIVLTLEAMKALQLSNCIQIARDGEEAMQYLQKEGRFENAETPDLVLLDINLPRMNGKEVLAQIKNDEFLMTIPVVMLTTSDSEKDILESYQNHANCYITKPAGYKKFINVVSMIKDFWINIAQLPHKENYEPKK